MTLLIAAALGAVLGYTSHIKQSLWSRVQGIAEGLAIVSAANWLFYNLNILWWLSLILAVVVYALYLMIMQLLLKAKVGVPQLP